MLSCLFDQYGGIEGPGKILREMDTKELEVRHALHFGPINIVGSVCGVLFSPPTISSLVFWELNARLLLAHHVARC